MAWALLHNCLTTLLAMRKGINSIMQVGKKHTLNMQLEINNLYIQINKLPSPPPTPPYPETIAGTAVMHQHWGKR